MQNNLLIVPPVADEAINLLQVFTYDPLLIYGSANAELITAMERKLNGLFPFVIENDPEAILVIKKKALDGEIKCEIISDDTANKFAHLVADLSGSSGPELIKELTKNADRVSINGRFVAIIPTTKTIAFKALVQALNAWIEPSLVNDKISFFCLNKR